MSGKRPTGAWVSRRSAFRSGSFSMQASIRRKGRESSFSLRLSVFARYALFAFSDYHKLIGYSDAALGYQTQKLSAFSRRTFSRGLATIGSCIACGTRATNGSPDCGGRTQRSVPQSTSESIMEAVTVHTVVFYWITGWTGLAVRRIACRSFSVMNLSQPN